MTVDLKSLWGLIKMFDVKIEPRPKIVEGVDYYREPGGRMVFTEAYHFRRGYCCNGRCRHCPWKEEKMKREENSNIPDVVDHAVLKGV